MNPDLSKLTDPERLYLWRKAKGWDLVRTAVNLGVGRGRLHAVELGRKDGLHLPLHIKQYQPTLPDLLRLARRRSGLGLREVAALVPTSHVTVLYAERRGEATLVKFWRGRGFRFPVGMPHGPSAAAKKSNNGT